MSKSERAQRRSDDWFGSTRWSLVLKAVGDSSAAADGALATLCETYWFPLYAYARRKGKDAHEARDLTQEFFARLIENNYLAQADPHRGRFRSFLLTVFKHFLANEWTKAIAQKRGGGAHPISLDCISAESRLAVQPYQTETAEKIFDRQWAETLVDQVMATLEAEYVRRGKQQLFEHLKVGISGGHRRGSYANAAAELGMTDGAVRVAAHRLRQRFGQLVRQEVADTVNSPEDLQDEIQRLFAAFSR